MPPITDPSSPLHRRRADSDSLSLAGRLLRRHASADVLPRNATALLRRYHSTDAVPATTGDASSGRLRRRDSTGPGGLLRRNSADVLPRVTTLPRRHGADAPSAGGGAGRRTAAPGPRWSRWALLGAAATLALVAWCASSVFAGKGAQPALGPAGERHLGPLALRAGAPPPPDGDDVGREQDNEDYDYDYDYVHQAENGNDYDYDYVYLHHDEG